MTHHREFLEKTGWLSLTPTDFSNKILDKCTVETMSRQTSIYRQGDQPGGLWGVAAGAVVPSVSTAQDGPAITYLGPGFWFGEGSVIRPDARRIGCHTATTSVLFHITRNDLMEILSKNPVYWRWIALLSTMSTALAMSIACDQLISKQLRRTAATLFRMTSPYSGVFPMPAIKEIFTSQADLANATNMSRVALNQNLKKIESKGAIKVAYGRIEIMDSDLLANIATH